jgi:hypothetical protein
MMGIQLQRRKGAVKKCKKEVLSSWPNIDSMLLMLEVWHLFLLKIVPSARRSI